MLKYSCNSAFVKSTVQYAYNINNTHVHKNVLQVSSILFETNFIIRQLAMFDLLLRFDHRRRPSSGTAEKQFLKKAADGGRNVEVSRTLLVV